MPGLKQFFEGSATLDEILENDTIYAGGADRFGNELINQTAFKELLKTLKQRYSWIVASSPASLSSAEAENLILLFDAVFLAITSETLGDLNPLLSELVPLREEKPIAFMNYRSLT